MAEKISPLEFASVQSLTIIVLLLSDLQALSGVTKLATAIVLHTTLISQKIMATRTLWK